MEKEEITKEEVRRVIMLMKNGKARGRDGLVSEMMKSGGETGVA